MLMNNQYFGSHIIQIDRVSSTNNYAAKLLNQTKIPFGAVIMAQFQDDGKLEGLESSKGWRQFTSGFTVGAFGGDVVAYTLLANIGFFA